MNEENQRPLAGLDVMQAHVLEVCITVLLLQIHPT